MRKRTREILAIVLLGALLAVGVGAMGYYIVVGHGWNVTASHIDDSIGQMEGYTVILYEGTRPSPADAERISDEQPLLDDQARGAATGAEESSGGGPPLKLDDVAQSYREKGASVFSVDIEDLPRYREPFVVGKDGKRLGFFSATRPVRKAAVKAAVKDLARQGAHCTVALTDGPSLYKKPVQGVSIVICDDGRAHPAEGEYRESAFCVGTPYFGEIGAIVMSPSGVLSAKTIIGL